MPRFGSLNVAAGVANVATALFFAALVVYPDCSEYGETRTLSIMLTNGAVTVLPAATILIGSKISRDLDFLMAAAIANIASLVWSFWFAPTPQAPWPRCQLGKETEYFFWMTLSYFTLAFYLAYIAFLGVLRWWLRSGKTTNGDGI